MTLNNLNANEHML